MNRILAVRSLVPRAGKNFSTSARTQIENKVKESQTRFQAPDGNPIHLKKGGSDYAIYSFAMGLTAVGTLWSCFSLFKYAMPKK
ncbi:cytochrome c oxidase subunit 7A2, mitochondrial-like [Lytechinus variegatus]|uniref:cytochrome c oxidase subunit 7A2, mitochondrial-like n=1 Tax=Lytechinus variegatus TaxID=7654 RepID=UPI001BB22329|nr:cytochrome c oxidase subunit 7A2, mitochondrial-like [Lytechinus variegatus]